MQPDSPTTTQTAPIPAAQLREPQVVFAPGAIGGTLTVEPSFAELFARAGLTTADSFLSLPGEVVTGHPDRHVARVEIPGAARAFYLKRQHVVGWREKWRNRRAGFGWVSRCAREADLLKQLRAAGLAAPQWAAFGTHGRRAFLLLEEVPGAIELRLLLNDNTLSLSSRRCLADNIGRAIARVHAAGFTTPDLTAKHVLVDPESLEVTFLDWQSGVRTRAVSAMHRADALGALHASLAELLASRADRTRMLRAYSSARSDHGATEAQPILRAAARHAQRRSVRDQLQPIPATNPHRLVWLAGEAVCAVPEVAAAWSRVAIAPPFYGFGRDGASSVRFAGREAVLVRGRTSAPLGRFRAWLRATPWRSPGATAGRVLFHLERYRVSAPRLLAFGQRLVSATGAEWFVLFEAPRGTLLRKWRRTACQSERRRVFDALAECLRNLHDAGCVLIDARSAFAIALDGSVSIADPCAVRIVRRVSESARQRDRAAVAHLMGVE